MPPRPFGLHDGEGLNGARFIAGCIAAAFVEEDSRAVVDAGLRLLPDDSKYAEVARAVIEFHDAHPGDWRPCQEYLIASWGYDKWPGLCHVIPNAGVCVLALLYGRGNFARTVEIATMCGWDTDCNAGNVGTIAECCTVSIRFLSLSSANQRRHRPVGASGSLNILDIPTISPGCPPLDTGSRGSGACGDSRGHRAGRWGKRPRFRFFLRDRRMPPRLRPVGFAAAHRAGAGLEGGGALEFRFERLTREMSGKLFFKPFYRGRTSTTNGIVLCFPRSRGPGRQ